jgi:nucleoside-diphosphate-sugar epimerase
VNILKILILGINGFIGFHLAQALLEKGDCKLFGIDKCDDKVQLLKGDLEFAKADISKDNDLVENYIKECDVVIPLVAIATPALYIKEPIKVFELDFEENMKIVKLCVKYGKRIIFPSTSEVYGMSKVSAFNEDNSNLVVGPINKQRWIYSSCKQLLDRVIWAYGKEGALDFTIFRPFNWVGPYLDSFEDAKHDRARVVTQFAYDIISGKQIRLVDGGKQHRSFTYISDGIDCLMRIIYDREKAEKQIFNVGNPENNVSIKYVADYIIQWVRKNNPEIEAVDAVSVSGDTFYGESYEDVTVRVPDISKAQSLLGWSPKLDVNSSLDMSLRYLFNK